MMYQGFKKYLCIVANVQSRIPGLNVDGAFDSNEDSSSEEEEEEVEKEDPQHVKIERIDDTMEENEMNPCLRVLKVEEEESDAGKIVIQQGVEADPSYGVPLENFVDVAVNVKREETECHSQNDEQNPPPPKPASIQGDQLSSSPFHLANKEDRMPQRCDQCGLTCQNVTYLNFHKVNGKAN